MKPTPISVAPANGRQPNSPKLPAPLCFLVLGVTLVLVVTSGSSAAEPLRAMTYNIRYNNPRDGENAWPHRKDAVAKAIQDQRADVAGLQEVLQGQLNELKKRLPDYEVFGVGRDDGKASGEFSPIFYRRARLELLEAKTFWLSETPETPGSKSWDAAITRIVTQARFRDRATDSTFVVMNTHFDHRGAKARLESARLIAKRVAELSKDEPVIVMGDLNCTPGSAPYEALVQDDSRLQDARQQAAEVAGPKSTWNGFRAIADGRIIDHILVSPQWRVKRLQTLDPRIERRFTSDHLPVLAVIHQ